MSDKKYVVPVGMLKAVVVSMEARYGIGSIESHNIAYAFTVEAAIKWLAENPINPTQEQQEHLLKHFSPMAVERWDKVMWFNFIACCTIEWQRRMFLAPEPKIPEEIKDLCEGSGVTDETECRLPFVELNQRLAVAFRRGQKSARRGK